MRKLLLISMTLLALASVVWGAEEKTGMKGGKPYFEATDKITTHATVLAVDTTTRSLSVKTATGDTVTLNVKPDVKTLGQIKVGDRVKVVYSERVVIYVTGGGEAEITEENMRADAEKGQNPSASITQRTQVKATITAIDTTAHTATLKGVDGKTVTVTPRHPANLKLVKVGDLVTWTYTSTLAASVEKVPAKAPAKAAPAKTTTTTKPPAKK